MYRKSFLHPTNRTGVCGQNLLISGYHITLQFRKETGLVMEKHSNTTSDLMKPFQLVSISVKIPLGDSLTCRMRNVDPSRDRQMCPRDVATRLHCLLSPKIVPTPDTLCYLMLHIFWKIDNGNTLSTWQWWTCSCLTKIWVDRITLRCF